MNWSNVRHILNREVRDQLRDRRTLFMIFVLPLLLYPLLGISMLQVTQFVREQPTRVQIIGRDGLPSSPTLIDGEHFASRLFLKPEDALVLELTFNDLQAVEATDKLIEQSARRAVEQGDYEAVVYVPSDFNARLAAFRESLATGSAKAADVPSPMIFYSEAKEKSRLAYVRVSQVFDRWTDEIGRENLATRDLPASTIKPFTYSRVDIANDTQREAAIWSKILPFLLLIWALTGAFYPAVDLCAGEKERGTLETLLSSPAERIEIVFGKLLTVMLFSVTTAVLNIASMALTGTLVIAHLENFGPPPPMAPLWLMVALIPVSALFSALCLALAAFARSSKEGQYYLMPLVLVTMPLVILPMSPGVELSLGNSLIPLTGVVLLLRSVLEGNYLQALPYVPPVTLVTLGCCWLSLRWAVDQFNSESVLFRESERLDVGLWVRHLLRDREDTPTVTMALFCAILILMVRFFIGMAMPTPETFRELAVNVAISLLVVVATPALLMTVMLTRRPDKTLLLAMPPLASLPAAALLAILLHPLWLSLGQLLKALYPMTNNAALEAISKLLVQAPSIWVLLLLMAVLPAILEELAFRGFILSGLRHIGHKWWAIVISSVFFGITHGFLHQQINAVMLGILIGYLAVQTGSLLPCVIYHMLHNSLVLLISTLTPEMFDAQPLWGWLIERPIKDEIPVFHWPVVALGALLASGILYALHRLPYDRTPEEVLQEALDQSGARMPA